MALTNEQVSFLVDFLQVKPVPPPPPPVATPPSPPAPPAPEPPRSAEPEPAPVEAAPTHAAVNFTKARLEYDGVRKRVKGELQKLEKAILDDYKDQGANVQAEVAGKMSKLYEVFELMDDAILDRLDEAYTATTPNKKDEALAKAKGLVQSHLQFVNGDPLLALMDSNEFTAVHVKSDLVSSLNGLLSMLG
ncbi:MAG: hypothetical protein JWR26_2829 [Pedosphaera sp.]|nr:hypothetical protein [Pedosphaera sp.]